MKVELTKDEVATLDAVLDAGVKAIGLRAVTGEMLSIRSKLTEAIKQASAEQESSPGA
jgi:hypothetical protein